MKVFFTFLFTLVFSAALILAFPELTINPGKISAGHQKFSKDCLKCHTPLQGATEVKCVDCHKSDQIGLVTTTGKPISKNLISGKPILAKDTTKVLFHQSLTNSDCMSCHILHSVIGQDKEPVKFQHDFLAADMKNECASCHEKNRPNDDLHRNTKDNCNACHTNKAWKPASFDHKKLSAQTSCLPCHKKERPNDELHRNTSDNCITCHSTNAWKPASFDHKKLSAQTSCLPCHQKERPNDDLHSNAKENCITCHSTKAWTPATFNHDKYFVFDRNHPSKCVTCHTKPNAYKEYTCYGCHEHSQARIARKHQKEGIDNFEKCADCHRTGDEDDAKRERN